MSFKTQSSNVECSEPVRDMGYSAELKKSSRQQQMSGTAKEKILSPHENQSLKLRENLKSEKFINQSNTDLHRKIKREVVDGPLVPPKSLQYHQKQWSNIKATQDEEVVKYMSNLPCYLQRVENGENLQEKALNFGVLDWGRLEKWKYNQKPVPSRTNMYTPSTSNASSPFSTVRSSSVSSRSLSDTLADQRTQSPSPCSNLNSSPKDDDRSQGVKSFGGNDIDLQEFRAVTKNTIVGQKKLPRTDQSCGRYDSEIEMGKGKRKDSNPKIIPEIQTSSSISKDSEVPFCPKGKMKVGDDESDKRTEELPEVGINLPDLQCPGRPKNVTLLPTNDCSQNNCSGISKQSGYRTPVDGRSTEAKRKSFSDSFYFKEKVHFADLHSDIPHSHPLPCRVESSQQSDLNLPGSLCAQGNPSDAVGSTPSSYEVPTSQPKDAGKKKSTIKPTNSIVIEASDRLGPKAAEAPAAKVRNPSSNHRSSIDLDRLSRSLNPKEGSAVPQLSSTYVTAKSGPVRSGSSACLDNSTREKTNANTKSRSSPLRRLLDPLLKPKVANHPKSIQEESTSMHGACKSSDERLDSSAVHSVKRNLNLSSCGSIDANDPCLNEKHVASTVQALMQVTVKNEQPWFTFAVDSTSDVLAATMKRVSTSRKDDCSWIYTFYTVREIKKSGGWMNQGSKGKGHGYASNVVGQMKVSLSQCPMLTGHDLKDHLLVREFVLFGVEPKHADQKIPDFQPNSELAAIVVKVPRSLSDGWQSENSKDLSDIGLTGCLPEQGCLCSIGENLQSEHIAGTQNHSGAVVILPSGAHGLPSMGVPSPLIDRWKSGGSCDCGGWDVGCKLRILANQDRCNKSCSSIEACHTPDRFDLFIQGGAQRNRPVFSLAPFKEGIYSVDFHGSISVLQAFSICIAILNNRRPCDLSEMSNLFEAKTSQETMSIENDRIKASNREEPSRYAPFPPHSPVGRV